MVLMGEQPAHSAWGLGFYFFFKYFILFLLMCVHLCRVCAHNSCVHELQGPEELGPDGAGVTGGSESPNVSAGKKTDFL